MDISTVQYDERALPDLIVVKCGWCVVFLSISGERLIPFRRKILTLQEARDEVEGVDTLPPSSKTKPKQKHIDVW